MKSKLRVCGGAGMVPLVLSCVFVNVALAERQDESPLGQFPAVKSETLSKQQVELPQDFKGERNLLFIAFERKQQKDVDTWIAEMKRFEDADPSFRYYEIPTIAKLSRFYRWFINSGMRNGIPDKAARERTITLYLDKKPFERSLNIPDEKQIHAVLVDSTGKVLWRAAGPYTEAAGKDLTQFLQKLHPAQPGAPKGNGADMENGEGRVISERGLQLDQERKPPADAAYVPLTNGQRWHRYWRDTLLSPGLYFASAGAALGDQASNSPKEWGGGWGGYARRTGSLYGLFLSQETMHQAGAAAFRTDPRYFRCECHGGLRRSWHAIAWSFVTYNSEGRLVFDLPQLVGAYGSGILSRTWYPPRYSPFVQGVQTGNMQVGFVVGIHLIQEFSPEIRRVVPRGSRGSRN